MSSVESYMIARLHNNCCMLGSLQPTACWPVELDAAPDLLMAETFKRMPCICCSLIDNTSAQELTLPLALCLMAFGMMMLLPSMSS